MGTTRTELAYAVAVQQGGGGGDGDGWYAGPGQAESPGTVQTVPVDADADGVDDRWSAELLDDSDGDGRRDLCDPCPQDALDDSDGDEVCDDLDACSGDDRTGDADGDGWCAAFGDGAVADCDDTNPAIFPGAPERCDGADSSCAVAVLPDEVDDDGDGRRPCDEDRRVPRDPTARPCGCRSVGAPCGMGVVLLIARRRRFSPRTSCC